MADVFSRATDSMGGSWASDSASVTFPAMLDGSGNSIAADIGLLVQRMQTAYSQQVTRLYELGKGIYYVGGRTGGEIAMDRIIGPRVIASEFYANYGDVCRAKTNTLNFSLNTGCHTGGSSFSSFVDYTCYFCLITSISIGINSSDMLINEALRLMFSSFEYKEGGSPGNSSASRSASSLAPQAGNSTSLSATPAATGTSTFSQAKQAGQTFSTSLTPVA